MKQPHDWVYEAHGPHGDAQEAAALGRELERAGMVDAALSAWDRAYGLEPGNDWILENRQRLLDMYAFEFGGMLFRYVPGGTFLMGSAYGDADEQPVHAVNLRPYWIADVPVSLTLYCQVRDYDPPPKAWPRDETELRASGRDPVFMLAQENKIRLRYGHDGENTEDWYDDGATFGKAVTAVSWLDAESFCEGASTDAMTICLPTEAEWEKAARGGLIGARYPWGDAPPTRDVCDFGSWEPWEIAPMRQFPANGYGLHAIAGGVWEWTADWYDAMGYVKHPTRSPTGPGDGKQKVLRGGSWTDCADAVTVSFRMGLNPWNDKERGFGQHYNPNVGFRVVARPVDQPLTARSRRTDTA